MPERKPRTSAAVETETEVVAEAVEKSKVTVKMEKATENLMTEKEPKSVLVSLIEELATHPERAVDLVRSLGCITKPWEPIGMASSKINEMPVPPGEPPKKFIKGQEAGPYISGYRLITIFGDEVASILKDTPKWKIVIQGEYQVDAPFVQHSQKAEANAKAFVEEKLKLRGFVIPK